MTSNQLSNSNRTNNAVFLIDLQTQSFCYVNDHACEKLGYSREELLRMGILDIDPLMNAASLQKITEQITRQGFSLLETYYLTKAGRLFPVEVSGNVFDYQGARLGLFVARDLTERNYKEAEKQHLMDILEESADFIGSADMEGRLLYHNPAARRMVGLAEDADLSMMSIADMCPAWVFQLMCETVIPTIMVHGTWQGETAILHRDGRETPVFQTVVLHRDADGKPLFMSSIMHDLTERKQKEAQLALLDYAFNYVDEAIYLIDENAQFVQVNEKACRDLGYTREELLQLKIFDIDPDYTAQHWKQRQYDIAEGLLSVIVETRHQTKEGRVFPIEVRASHIPYQGQLYDIAMVRDISERKQRDEQLKLLDYAFNYVDEGIFLINSDAHFVQINEKACLSLGYSREELLSLTIFDIDPAFTPELWQKLLAEHEQGTKSITVETRHRTNIGVVFPVEVRGHYIVYQGQKYSVAIVRDITARKAAEKQLTLLNYALDHIKEEVWLIDENAMFHYVNQAACRSIGCSHQEMRQLSVPDIKPDYSLEQWQEDWQRIKTAGSCTFETRHQSKEGDIFPVEVNASYFELDGQGYSLTFSHDISERQRVEETLKFVAQRGWKDRNESFLVALTQYLAQLFQVDYVIIDKIGTSPTQAETVALCVKGAIVPNMQYSLKGTPCDNVINGTVCCYSEKVQQLFPEDSLLVDMQAESYAGIPLWDTAGNVVGLIAVLDSKPIKNQSVITSTLQLVATSVAAELERQQAEQRLLDSHHFLEQILNTIADPVFVKDRQHRWILLNQAFCEYIGHPLEQLLGKSDYDIHLPQEADVFWEKDELVFSTGVENSNEETATNADGLCRTVLTKKRDFIDSTGQQFLVGIITDLTERKRMENELAAREQQFRVLAETLPSPVFRFDKDCRRIYVNPIAEKISGIAAADLLYRKASDASPLNAEVMKKVEQTIEQVLKTGEPQEEEVLFKVPVSEQIYYFHNNYAPEFDANGEVASVIVISHDITERKRMENELAAREREFRTLANNVPGILIRYDEKCRMRYVNQRLIEDCDQQNASKIGQTLLQAYPNDPLFAELHEIIRKVIETGQSSETERYFPNHQGGGTWVFRHVAETDDNGNIIGALALGQDISERKRMENTLAAREHEFRTLAENVPDNLLRYDLQCRLHYMNPATMLSLAAEAVPTLGKTPSQSFPNNDVAKDIHDGINYAIETGKTCDMEVTWLNANGEIGVHHLSCVAERDSEGIITGALMIGRDITEHKKMERILRQREQEFRVLVETSPSPIIRYDAQCHRTYINPAVEKMAGKTAAQMLDHAPSEGTLLNEHVKNEIEHILQSVLTTGQITESEVELVLADGQTHYFYNRYAPELDANGKAVGVVLVGHDITARKQAEQLLVQREQEFRSLAENMPDNLLRYDTQGCLRYMNRAMQQSLAPEILLEMRKSSSEVFADNNEESKKMRQLIDKVITTGETIEIEEMSPNPQGEIRAHRIRFTPELDNAGKIVGAFGIGRDITERKQMEATIKQREQEFRTLVDNLPTVVLRYNRHLQRIYANPTYLQIMGKTEAELLSEPLEETWMATNISVTSYKAILNQVMHDGEKQELLLEWTDRHGELTCHALKIVPEYAFDGQIQSALVLGFDFSEQRRQQIIENNRQQVFEKMAHNHSLETILEQVALYVESAKAGSYCAILLMDEANNQLELVAAPSFPETYCTKSLTLTLEAKNQHCLGWATSASCKKRVILENLQEHPCVWLCQDFIEETRVVSCWSEPIISSANQLLGVVTLYLNSAAQPDENDLALLVKAVHLSAIAIERKRIEQQMIHQASYDALTELPNRRLFHNRLQEEISKAERRGHQLAVLFIDLDHFKDVNDTLGHQIGDNLLIHAAQRIQSCVRQSDTVARLGGDEFVVILSELGDVPPVERTAQAIIRAMTQPFILSEYHTYVSASVGIAMYPEDASNAEMLVSCADQAMYAAKESGRSSFNFFTRSMQEQAQKRLYLVNSLRDALEKNQLEVHYQPIIEVASGKAVKAEALLRWHHPALGMVSPAVFIPLAEETDLIQEIGGWVFCQAADMAKYWNRLSGANELRKISINMSPRQLIKGRGDQIAIDYLQAIALDSIHIVVEITEGLLLDDSPHITEKLERLRTSGIELSLDDFGTGYSAMAYLKKFDINYLKIDRSFVRELETNPDDRAITEAIVVMAHRLGLKVIAEGVETEGQLALLAAVGCEYIQGYFYAKPMPAKAFLSYVLN